MSEFREIHILERKDIYRKLTVEDVKFLLSEICRVEGVETLLSYIDVSSIAIGISNMSREKYNVLISMLGE